MRIPLFVAHKSVDDVLLLGGGLSWCAIWKRATILATSNIQFSRSDDNGQSWSAARSITPPDSDQDKDPDFAYDGNGVLVVVFTSDNFQTTQSVLGYDINFIRSDDNGATWTVKDYIGTASQGTSTDDSQNPKVATDGNGAWVVVYDSGDNFESPIKSNLNEIISSQSLDNGVTWSTPLRVAFTDTYADRNPAIATNKKGVWMAVWNCEYSSTTDVCMCTLPLIKFKSIVLQSLFEFFISVIDVKTLIHDNPAVSTTIGALGAHSTSSITTQVFRILISTSFLLSRFLVWTPGLLRGSLHKDRLQVVGSKNSSLLLVLLIMEVPFHVFQLFSD